MRCKYDGRALSLNGIDDLLQGRRREGRLTALPHAACLENGYVVCDLPHLQNLGPPITEPPIAKDQALLSGRKLPRHGFHGEGAATGHDDCRARCKHS